MRNIDWSKTCAIHVSLRFFCVLSVGSKWEISICSNKLKIRKIFVRFSVVKIYSDSECSCRAFNTLFPTCEITCYSEISLFDVCLQLRFANMFDQSFKLTVCCVFVEQLQRYRPSSFSYILMSGPSNYRFLSVWGSLRIAL